MFKRVARRVRKSEQETRAIPKKRQVDGSDDSEQEDVSDDVSSSSEEDVADEESDNDDDDDDDSVSSGSEDDGEGSSGKRKRTDDGDDDESGSESSSSAAPAGPSLTIAEALENPIFYLPNDDDDEEEEEEMDAAAVARAAPTGCVLCPGKEMKNPYMVEVHLTSKPHARALKRFRARIENMTEEDLEVADPFEITAQIDEELANNAHAKSSQSSVKTPSKKKQAALQPTSAAATTESSAKAAKKREWKERTKEAKRLRAEKKRMAGVAAAASPVKSSSSKMEATSGGGHPKNRVERRIEALEADLGVERVQAIAGGAKGQERIKLLLAAKKKAGEGTSSADVKKSQKDAASIQTAREVVAGEDVSQESQRKRAKKNKAA